MREAADTSGTWRDVAGSSYPLVQVVTVEELLKGQRPKIPLIIPPYPDARPVNDLYEEGMLFDL